MQKGGVVFYLGQEARPVGVLELAGGFKVGERGRCFSRGRRRPRGMEETSWGSAAPRAAATEAREAGVQQLAESFGPAMEFS